MKAERTALTPRIGRAYNIGSRIGAGIRGTGLSDGRAAMGYRRMMDADIAAVIPLYVTYYNDRKTENGRRRRFISGFIRC